MEIVMKKKKRENSGPCGFRIAFQYEQESRMYKFLRMSYHNHGPSNTEKEFIKASKNIKFSISTLCEVLRVISNSISSVEGVETIYTMRREKKKTFSVLSMEAQGINSHIKETGCPALWKDLSIDETPIWNYRKEYFDSIDQDSKTKADFKRYAEYFHYTSTGIGPVNQIYQGSRNSINDEVYGYDNNIQGNNLSTELNQRKIIFDHENTGCLLTQDLPLKEKTAAEDEKDFQDSKNNTLLEINMGIDYQEQDNNTSSESNPVNTLINYNNRLDTNSEIPENEEEQSYCLSASNSDTMNSIHINQYQCNININTINNINIISRPNKQLTQQNPINTPLFKTRHTKQSTSDPDHTTHIPQNKQMNSFTVNSPNTSTPSLTPKCKSKVVTPEFKSQYNININTINNINIISRPNKQLTQQNPINTPLFKTRHTKQRTSDSDHTTHIPQNKQMNTFRSNSPNTSTPSLTPKSKSKVVTPEFKSQILSNASTDIPGSSNLSQTQSSHQQTPQDPNSNLYSKYNELLSNKEFIISFKKKFTLFLQRVVKLLNERLKGLSHYEAIELLKSKSRVYEETLKAIIEMKANYLSFDVLYFLKKKVLTEKLFSSSEEPESILQFLVSYEN
eukprot:CAMPEP_0170536994 /NCGR_PEP_ID=MMETSP0209-20121228/102461_1 /TAXON_ID=665100 ORGANISM="Litonotus pictus, Strain P1" /NCGR_SAMPLE_ID=MMETSP0209 /ASSEMBLY_ACC=CAM_ASM_000301 /LENGTH=619 /DNA_ID=CAMNT_0010838429 /DNA_START=514 /DNA_END=2374 /DNA_ORIENTATION=-